MDSLSCSIQDRHEKLYCSRIRSLQNWIKLMKNNHKYFPEDKARKIIERHLEDAGIYNKAKIEKENDVFKIIFNTQDRNEAVKDALKLSMSLLEIESYSYKLLKYPVIFIHSNGIIANIHDMTAHDVIKDINRYLFGGKPRKNSNTRSIFKFYRGLIYSFAKPREALMRGVLGFQTFY
jgi:hypothetical protein